jgi:hypothetical protein
VSKPILVSNSLLRRRKELDSAIWTWLWVGGAGPFHGPLHIGMAYLENTTGRGILDSSNMLYGIVNLQVANASGSPSVCNANVSGGAHLTIHYVNCQPDASGTHDKKKRAR